MTFQWTAVASFLYGEIALLLILCIPFVSPLRWRKIFRFQLWSKISPYWNKAFLSIIVVLVVLFLDAVREVRKYSSGPTIDKGASLTSSSYDHIHMKLFRSQRNLYISGFSLFLWLVLRRVISLINQLASVMDDNDARQTQVEKVNEAAKKHMQDNDELKKALDSNKVGKNEKAIKAENVRLKKEIEDGKDELKRMSNALSTSQAEFVALKKQSEGLTREYDRLLKEHEQLQNIKEEQHDKKDL
ncbi:PREDICTED: B-cell receptor-associated protein 29 [Nanorana parkeri]|uniref:B-cell receptor-associated protein 29 n=1 Tax=Nanorana parkeri TaxID=125878 RepID=UPI0008546CD3|nr:PREDICTED: B-cell receptor-associated protein 29 [Nanorana parkeri]XP_018412580.1 PREDICTED: B-cell receptor-associated protein 29 [Nanorana parkeri]XP_018412581.1 PREDICTED: B-cell receptor-associated protein 29 [Nanorana parkeri]